MAVRKGLGRGLDSMFPKYTQTDETAGSNDAAKEEEKGRRKKTEQKTDVVSAVRKPAKAPSDDRSQKEADAQSGPVMVKISRVEPNRNQPRTNFNEDLIYWALSIIQSEDYVLLGDFPLLQISEICAILLTVNVMSKTR